MEKNKFIKVNYKGSKIEVLLSDNYKSFIENIKRKLHLSNEDCNKMSFKLRITLSLDKLKNLLDKKL